MAGSPSLARSSAGLWTDLQALRFLHAVAERRLLQFDEDNAIWGLSDVLTVVLLGWGANQQSLRQIHIS